MKTGGGKIGHLNIFACHEELDLGAAGYQSLRSRFDESIDHGEVPRPRLRVDDALPQFVVSDSVNEITVV